MKINKQYHKTKTGVVKRNPQIVKVKLDNNTYTLNDMKDWFLLIRGFPTILSFGKGKNRISGEGQSGGRRVCDYVNRVESLFVKKLGRQEYISRMDVLLGKKKVVSKPKQEVKKLDLSHFTGSMERHKFTLVPIYATDGIVYLIEKGLHWLFSDMAVASVMKIPRQFHDFIVWHVDVKDIVTGQCVVSAWTDTPNKSKKLYEQRYKSSSFYSITGRKLFNWYQEGNMFLLRTEH